MPQAERVPQRIHYCWFGRAPLSELGERCVATWREQMPDFAIERWDESRLDRRIPYVDLAYRARKFAFVSDYVRFLALYEHGGIYLDTDVEVVRPLDGLLGQPLFFGLQAPESVGCGVIGAVKGHPFLRRILDELDAEARRGQLSYRPIPELVTALLRAPDAAATLFPEEYFYPYNPHSPVVIRRKPLQSNLSERTFCIHHWEGSWLGDASLRMLLGLRLKAALRRANPAHWRQPALQASRP